MKTFIICLFSFFALMPAFAQERLLPAPEALRTQAEKDQQGLMDSVNALMFNYAEIRDGEEFDAYFALLPVFQELATKFYLDELYPGAVPALGHRLTLFGVRWLDVRTDSMERIMNFHKWANVAAAQSFMDRMDQQIKFSDKEDELIHARDILLELQDWAATNFPTATQLVEGYRELSSKLAMKFLNREDLTKEQRAEWLRSLQTENAIWEYAQVIRSRILGRSAPSVATLTNGVFEVRLLLETVMDEKRGEVARSLVAYLQDLLRETVTRLVELRVQVDLEEVKLAIAVFGNRQLQDLSFVIMSPQRTPAKNFMQYFLDLADIVLAELRERGLSQDAHTLDQYLVRQSGSFYALLMDIEGTYELKTKRGEKFFFTVIRTQENEYRAAFSPASQLYSMSSMTIVYDREQKRFLALEREADTEHWPNALFMFSLKGGTMQMYYPHGKEDLREMTGKRTQRYPDYFESRLVPNADPIEGEFEGNLVVPGGNSIPVRLIIVPVGLRTYGRLQAKSFDINLQLGTDGGEGFVYLTSGQFMSNNFVQLRAWKDGDNLRALYIVGGRGIAERESFFKKVKSLDKRGGNRAQVPAALAR